MAAFSSGGGGGSASSSPVTSRAGADERAEGAGAGQEQLATVQQDLQDERAKVSALAIERDAAVKAARGGGFWSRLRNGAKWFVIGGALGALAASAARR